MTKSKRQKQAKVLRIFRKVHRISGALLFFFFLFVSLSGLLLTWKKNSNGVLLPVTQQGTSSNLELWLPLDSLAQLAHKTAHSNINTDLDLTLDRIDVRNEKGIAKFRYKEGNWEVQLDGVTGEVLSTGKRYSDVLENIHDGSIIDAYLPTNGYFKLVYASIMGLGLLLFTVTGFWLWYGPKVLKKTR